MRYFQPIINSIVSSLGPQKSRAFWYEPISLTSEAEPKKSEHSRCSLKIIEMLFCSLKRWRWLKRFWIHRERLVFIACIKSSCVFRTEWQNMITFSPRALEWSVLIWSDFLSPRRSWKMVFSYNVSSGLLHKEKQLLLE